MQGAELPFNASRRPRSSHVADVMTQRIGADRSGSLGNGRLLDVGIATLAPISERVRGGIPDAAGTTGHRDHLSRRTARSVIYFSPLVRPERRSPRAPTAGMAPYVVFTRVGIDRAMPSRVRTPSRRSPRPHPVAGHDRPLRARRAGCREWPGADPRWTRTRRFDPGGRARRSWAGNIGPRLGVDFGFHATRPSQHFSVTARCVHLGAEIRTSSLSSAMRLPYTRRPTILSAPCLRTSAGASEPPPW